MAESSIIIQWGSPFAGREQMGLGVFMAAIEYYTGLKGSGDIEDFSIYLNNNGNFSQQQGTMLVIGSLEQINAVVQRDDYQALVTKASHVVDNLFVSQADTGNAVMQRIEKLQAIRKELGIS